MNQMSATFCMSVDALQSIAQADAKKCGSEVAVEIRAVVSDKISCATGPTQAVMFLIGAVAANGEDSLYKADVL